MRLVAMASCLYVGIVFLNILRRAQHDNINTAMVSLSNHDLETS